METPERASAGGERGGGKKDRNALSSSSLNVCNNQYVRKVNLLGKKKFEGTKRGSKRVHASQGPDFE